MKNKPNDERIKSDLTFNIYDKVGNIIRKYVEGKQVKIKDEKAMSYREWEKEVKGE